MKRLLNKLVLGAVVASITALGAVTILAQDDAEKAALYTKFTECYKAQDDPGIAACITVGNEYIQKYGATPDQYVEFVNKQLVNLKARPALNKLKAAYAKLDAGIKSKNLRDAFNAGKEILSLETKEATKLDITILLATLGYDMAFSATPDNTYNSEAINYAKNAIRMMESGTASEPRQGANNTTIPASWGGPGSYAYKSKDNALAWMNFTIGRLTADTNKDQTRALVLYKEAAPYFFKSLQYNSEIKKDPTAYKDLGRYYREELNNTVDLYAKCCKDLTEDTDEAKRLRGLQLAYAERGADAYARAYQVALDAKQAKTVTDALLKTLTDFYNARFKSTTGVTEFVSKTVAKPLIDPKSEVVPVAEEPVVTTTTTGTTPPAAATTTGTGAKPPVTAPATTKPPTTKPSSTVPAKPAGSTKGTISKKAPAKKKAGK